MRLRISSSALRIIAAFAAIFALLAWSVAPAKAIAGPGRISLKSIEATAKGRAALPMDPQQREDLTLTLVSITPTNVTSTATVQATVAVKNNSTAAINGASLVFGLLSDRITDRESLATWSAYPQSDTSRQGATIASSKPAAIAPGSTVNLSVQFPASALALTKDESLWGPRKVTLTLVENAAESAPAAAGAAADSPEMRLLSNGGTVRKTLRTFLVWNPTGKLPAPVHVTYVAPVSAQDPAGSAYSDAAFRDSMTTGQLSERSRIAQIAGVSWLIDPSVVDQVALPLEGSSQSAAKAILDGPKPADSQTQATGTVTATSDAGGATPAATATTAATAAPSASASSSATPTPAPSNTPQVWSEPAWWTDYRSQLSKAAAEHSVMAAPYAQANTWFLTSAVRSGLSKQSATSLKAANITSAGTMIRFDGNRVNTDDVINSGADAALIPAESMFEDQPPAITPSGFGVLRSGKKSMELVGYDSTLTALAEDLGASSDPQAVNQRMLADIAVIAGQDTVTTRYVVIAPSATATLTSPTTANFLRGIEDSPWASMTALKDVYEHPSKGPNTKKITGSTDALWVGEVSKLTPVSVTANRTVESVKLERFAPSAAQVQKINASLELLQGLGSAMEGPPFVAIPTTVAASSLSPVIMARTDTFAGRAESGSQLANALASRITLTLSSTYNLVSSGAGVPVSVRNDFDTTITLTPSAQVSKRIVRVHPSNEPITIAPHSTAEVSIPVEAISSGTVTFTATITTPSGYELHTQSSSLTANPSWENWTTMILMVGMGLLVVVGVLRAGRTKSDARAPRPTTPEDVAAIDHPKDS